MLEKLVPENDFERDILSAKRQAIPISALLDKLVSIKLFVSSMTEVMQDGSGFSPLLAGTSEQPLVCAFTSISRPALHRERASYILSIAGDEFVLRLPPIYGLIVNAGYEAQLVVMPEMVAELAQKLRAERGAAKS